MKDVDLFEYALSYPCIKHPLENMQQDFKVKYMALLEYYAHKYCKNSLIGYERLFKFRNNFLCGIDENSITFNADKFANSVLRMRFKPFHLYSFRLVFLFDCLFLFAPFNDTLGNEICESLKPFVFKHYYNQMKLMVKKMYGNDANFIDTDTLITQKMINSWNNVQAFQRTRNCNILFTATISAGKSTLINSLIGEELSFAKQAACTSTIIKFISTPIYNPYFHIIYNSQHMCNVDAKSVRSFTKKCENPCEIIGYFDSYLCKNKVTLIDTPGVNSVIHTAHKSLTRIELEKNKAEIIVYVISVENYGAEDDFIHLKFILDNIDYKNIIFVINMMDTCDLEDDSIEEIVNNISEHLIKIGFKEPIVCPLSARAGMLIKKLLCGHKLSDNNYDECSAFIVKYLNPKMSLKGYYPQISEEDIMVNKSFDSNKYDLTAIKSAFTNTGLPGFELLLLQIIKGAC